MNDKTAAEVAAEQIDGGTVQPVSSDPTTVATDVTPSHDDETPAVVGDAKVDDGVVRTNSAVEPIADVLTAGAGAPKPPPSNVGPDGREVFEDGVPPTALTTYTGPGAPPEQTGEPGDQSDPDPANEDPGDEAAIAALVDENDSDELAALATERGLSTSGTKTEVATRIVEYDRDNA